MNLLTKSLLEDLLDIKKTVAIYGGGFKPPTKGHFNVAELALSELPDIDELKIFVGGGVRDGITQNESIQVWDIYKKYLSPKVSVEPSVAPVKSVLGYAKENPDTKVYWVLGARDGEESDLMDIKNRTKSLDKYPNLEVKVITSKGGISGTKTRTAIKANNKEQFFHFIPDIEEKEQVWDIVSPVVKEVEMGMIPTDVLGKHTQQDMDSFMTNIKDKFQKFISALKQEGQETKKAISLLIKSAKGDIELSDEQKEQIGNQLKDVLKTIGLIGIATLPGGFIAGALIKLFKAESLVTPSAFVNEVGEANLTPYKWKEIDRESYYVYTRFITDSETQYDVDLKTTTYIDNDLNNLRALEIEFTAKPKGAEGSSAKIVINKGEMYKVMSTIVDIVKKYIKKSKSQAILYSPSKKSDEENFGTQRDNLYRAFISKAFPGVKFEQEGEIVVAILPGVNEGSCGYDTDVATGKKINTPGGLEEENLISETMTVYRLGEIPYDEESFFVTPDYKTWIKFYPGEEIHKITTNKLYLPLRSKSFLSWDELRSKYNSGEFTDDDVSYINPEESGIQDFEQYEIKPDDIIDLEQINLEEGRKKKPDPKKGTGKKPEGSDRRLYTDEDPKDTVRIKFKTKEDIVDTLNKTSFKAKSHARQSQVINLIHQRVRAAYGKAKDPEVKSRLKRALDYIEKRKEMSKKKTERLRKLKELVTATEVICDNCGWEWAIKDGGDDLYICHKCGHDNTPTQLNEGRYDSISRQLAKLTLNNWKEEFTKGKKEIKYVDRITPEEYPTDLEFIYNGLAIFTPQEGNYNHNGYAIPRGTTPKIGVEFFIPEDMIPQGWEEIYMDLIITLRHEIEHLTQSGANVKPGKEIYSDTKLRNLINTKGDVVRYILLPKEVDSNIQGLYLKAKKGRRPYNEVVDEWIRDFVKITNQRDIDLVKGIYNKRAKELNLPSILENDPFGLNELARQFLKEALIETWNPEESFVSLSRYMIDNGMNIKPLPKIKVIKDDEQNASDLLGKTAYYNPTEKSITLYTMDRHPKDILRSFAHEMVHHEQNLEGKLGNINTTNTNEDGDLPEIEKEAYQKGNMMFRNWEDSIKNV